MRNFSICFIILLILLLGNQGLQARTAYQGVTISNSIIVNSSSDLTVGGVSVTSNVSQMFNTSSYIPLYYNNSPIIGQGETATASDYDVEGKLRVGKKDLGAYEFKRITAGTITGNTAINVSNGTSAADAILKLVEVVTVEYGSVGTQTIKVAWTAPGGYNSGATPGKYTFTGTASYNNDTQIEFFELPTNATIEVTVNNAVIVDAAIQNGKIEFYQDANALTKYSAAELKNIASGKEIFFLPIPDPYYEQLSTSAQQTSPSSSSVTTSQAGAKDGLKVYKCIINGNTTVSATFKDVRNVFDLSIHGPLVITTAASGDMSISYNKPGVGPQTALPLFDAMLYLSSSSQTGNTVTVKGGKTANITLQGLSILAEGGKTAFSLTESTTTVNMTLQKGTTSSLKSNYGGSSGNYTGIPGIAVPQNTTLSLDGAGKLEAQGGGAVNSTNNYVGGAGIGGASGLPMGTVNIKGGIIQATGAYWAAGVGGGSSGGGGTLNITGGTLHAVGGSLHSDGKTGRTSGIGHGKMGSDGTITIDGGSVHATCEHDDEGKTPSDRPTDGNRPVNTSSSKLYMITVSTSGLVQDVMYRTTYPLAGDGSGTSVAEFLAAPDSNGQYFFWMVEDANKTIEKALFKDEATQATVATVDIIQIEKHDKNIAPIAVRIMSIDGSTTDYGSLKDAFDVVQNGETIQLLRSLTDIATTQAVKEGMRVILDLNGFTLDTRSDNSALFDASANGSALVITGNGTLKTNFRVKGNVYIDAKIGLTDARVTTGENNTAVWRTLVKDLPSGGNSIYNYSYAAQNDVPFYLNPDTKLACLWLPESQEELPLSIKVQSGGLTTQYTCGNIASKTHVTEPIRAYPVGVVAKVTTSSGSTSYPTINAAFTAANEKAALITLLAPITLTSSLTTMPVQDIKLDLAGFSIAASVGQNIQIPAGGTLTVQNSSTLVRGSIASDIQMKSGTSNGYVFIPGAITLTGKVTVGNVESYRLIVDVAQIPGNYTEITYGGKSYKVVNGEACLWMEAGTKDQAFTVNGQLYSVKALAIAKDHNNVVSLGGSDKEASVSGTAYNTFSQALAELNKAGEELILLKSSVVSTEEMLSRSATFQLGNNTLSGSGGGKLTVGATTNLVVTNGGKTGGIQLPVVFADATSSRLYIGTDVDKSRIGEVTLQDGTKLYRLLVSNLPENMGDGTGNTFKYNNYAGGFIIRNRIACLWLPEAVAKKLEMTVAGASFSLENVTINPDHGNTDKYGVSQVAQVVGGEKYTSLRDALNAAQSGGVVELLKSAALDYVDERGYSLLNSVTLDLKGYTVVSADQAKTFTIPSGKQLVVKGPGSMKLSLDVQSLSDQNASSNANLWVNPEVDMTGSTVKIGETPYFQTIVTGLKGVGVGEYEYGEGVTLEQGTLTPSADGTLCLWLKQNSTASEFRFTTTGGNPKTYLRGGVIIPGTHGNQIPLVEVTAEAITGGVYYNTLREALAAALSGGTVEVQKHLPNLSGAHPLAASTGVVTLDLKKKKITADGVTFSSSGAVLLVKDGTLEGNVTLSDPIFMSGSVQMGNTMVTKDGKTVWRLLLTMPKGTTSLSYKLGKDQAATTTYSHVQEIDGKAVACLWLPSSIMGQTLTVETTDASGGKREYALDNIIIASTHGNELDVESGNDPVASINTTKYMSLASAFSVAKEGETIQLERDVTPSTVQNVTLSVKFDLNGHNFTSVSSGFAVTDSKTLTVQNNAANTSPALIGTIHLNGAGNTSVDASVRIAGIVLDKDNNLVYRALVKVGPAALSASAECHWIYPKPLSFDLEVSSGTDTYEATIPANYTDQNTEVTAYKRVELTNATTIWDNATYKDVNLIIPSGKTLTITGANSTLHRLTIHDGGLVVGTTGQVTATEGIRYIRTFAAASKWESIALPFPTTRITAVKNGETFLLSPATSTGTMGDFWLYTMQTDGKQEAATTLQLEGNVSYIMAVASALANQEITFVSGPNQILRRNAVQAVVPLSGFASYANGTLNKLMIQDQCYVLNDAGDKFVRQNANHPLDPFRGYLLADMAITQNTPELRIGVATDNEAIVPPALDWQLTARAGKIIVETPQEMWLQIHTFSGYRIHSLRIPAGRHEIPVRDGFYIVNGRKVLVR